MMLYLILQAMVLVISERFHIRFETAREIYDNEATKTLNELFTIEYSSYTIIICNHYINCILSA